MPISKHPNLYKFLKPPTIEQIDEVVRKSGVTQTQFERYHGMAERAIAQVRCGVRDIPVRFWHLFLEEPKNQVAKRVAHTPKIDKDSTKKRRRKKTGKLSHLMGY